MKGADAKACKGQIFRYFEIGDVTSDGQVIASREDLFERLPSRGRLRVQKNDVLFAKNNSSRGTTVIVPERFDGHLTTTGFIGIRPADYDEALLLWSIFTSETFRKQVYYLAIGASQPEVRAHIFRDDFLLPVPRGGRELADLIGQARKVHDLQDKVAAALQDARRVAATVFEGRTATG